MGAFGGLIITNKGLALQAKAQIGAELNFTRIGVGDGTLGGQSISSLISLINEKMSLTITKLKVLGGGKAVVGGVLSNQDVTTGFYFREIGVFAMDPDEGEILYCYGNAGSGAEYIPPGGGPDVIEKQIDLVTIIGNASNVSADVASGIYALASDVGDMSTVPTTSKTVAGAITELFTSVSDGKALVAGAITDKGVPTSPSDTFATMAANIEAIPVGPDTSDATATPADILSGKTAYGAGGTKMTGTMPNHGAVIITPGTADQVIPAGYHNGAGKVVGDPDLVSANIKAGANIFGVTGKTEVVDTTETTAPASAGDILSGKVAFVNGVKRIGTMPNRTGHVTGQSISRNGTTLRIRPQAGYYPGDSGNSVQYSDPNWVAENIRQGVSIFGLVGSLIPGGEPIASGTVTSTSTGNTRQFVREDGTTTNNIYIEVSGLALPFEPNLILAVYKGGALAPILTIFSRDGLSDFYGTSQGKIMMCRGTNSTSSTSFAVWYRLDGSAVVTTTSFRLPVAFHNGTSGGNLFYWFIWG